MPNQLEPGATLGSYRILSMLGRGGMGEVYLAQDTRLDRKVALKVLPAHLVHDPERLRRFTQESRAASALNHPNILTIFEVGEALGLPFIASEFVQGETLRDRMTGTPLSLRESLDIAIQAAGALAAAHEAGIVHRDIKPENIMVRPDGYIKVLDFGLAKLTERLGSGDTQAATMTTPGVVMGTAQYMSPEQARGLVLDARSDLFSLGVVLYEMVAHRPPFEGETPSHLIVAILEKPAPPAGTFSPEVPPQLESILEKVLAKDREERYQTAKDLAVDLKAVRRRLDVETELRRSTPGTGYPAASVISGAYGTPPQVTSPPVVTPSPPASPPPAPPPVVPAESKRKPWTMRKRIRVAVIAIIAVYASRFPFRHGNSERIAAKHDSESFEISRVTTSGNVFNAAISPDARYIVYTETVKGETSVWMRQTAITSNIQIIPPAPVNYGKLTFSPDGNFLYFVRSGKGEGTSVYRIPVLGGTPVLVLTNTGPSIALSPDSKQLAFIRTVRSEPLQQDIMIADADGSGAHMLAGINSGELPRGLAWSPDGETIAVTVLSFEGGYHSYVLGYNASDGKRTALSKSRWLFIGDLAWSKSDDDLLVVATDQPSFNSMQIWHLDTDSKEARRLSSDLNGYSGVSVASGKDNIVTIQRTLTANLWVAPASNLSDQQQITMGGSRADGANGIAWTPDGRLVFNSRASGADEIWISDADGSNMKQLTSDNLIDWSPAVTPDGKFIVYTGTRSKSPQIWRMNLDGSEPRQLTHGKGADRASISADGKWVIFANFDTTQRGLERVSIDGGNPEKISDSACYQPDYSPDGKWILCGLSNPFTGAAAKLGILPAAGGAITKTFDLPSAVSGSWSWSPDSQSIYYVARQQGFQNIWGQPLSGGAPKQVTNYKSGVFGYYAWSPDGKRLALARGEAMADAVLLKHSD